jgi:hypothetical protein
MKLLKSLVSVGTGLCLVLNAANSWAMMVETGDPEVAPFSKFVSVPKPILPPEPALPPAPVPPPVFVPLPKPAPPSESVPPPESVQCKIITFGTSGEVFRAEVEKLCETLESRNEVLDRLDALNSGNRNTAGRLEVFREELRREKVKSLLLAHDIRSLGEEINILKREILPISINLDILRISRRLGDIRLNNETVTKEIEMLEEKGDLLRADLKSNVITEMEEIRNRIRRGELFFDFNDDMQERFDRLVKLNEMLDVLVERSYSVSRCLADLQNQFVEVSNRENRVCNTEKIIQNLEGIINSDEKIIHIQEGIINNDEEIVHNLKGIINSDEKMIHNREEVIHIQEKMIHIKEEIIHNQEKMFICLIFLSLITGIFLGSLVGNI